MSNAVKKTTDDFSLFLNPLYRDKISLQYIDKKGPAITQPASIGVASALEDEDVLNLIIEKKWFQICQHESLCLDKEFATSGLMLARPQEFIEKPVTSILHPDEAHGKSESQSRFWSRTFGKTGEKHEVLQSMISALGTHTKMQSLISDARLMMDELFTNVIFHSSSGGQVTIDRKSAESEGVKMPDSFFGEAFLGIDDDRLVLGVKDPFGTLSIDRLMVKIRECYRKGLKASMNMGPGGAGIGSFLVFSMASSYYLGLYPGKAAVVCATLPLRLSSRKRSELKKNIHLLEVPACPLFEIVQRGREDK